MNRATRNRPLALALSAAALTGAFASASASAADLYRWEDSEGNVHYTDSLPPEQAEAGHVILAPDGTPVRSVPRAKTQEEIRRERELQRVRAERQRMLAEQRAAVERLLATYRSIDDMLMMRDGKLAAIDVMTQVTKRDVRRQQDRLARAAEAEAGDAAQTEDAERSIRDALALILQHERQKQDVRDRFQRDIERFRELTEDDLDPIAEDAAEHEPDGLDQVLPCPSATACERLWDAAARYLRAESNRPVIHDSRDLLMTAAPRSEDDIALTLARIHDGGNGASLFLDVQCQSYAATTSGCLDARRREVLAGFRAAVRAAARAQR